MTCCEPRTDGQRLQNGVVGRALRGQDLLRRIALQLRHGQQQMLGGDVLVLEIGGFLEGAVQKLVGGLRERRPARPPPETLGRRLDLAVRLAQHGLRTDADLLQHRRDDAFFVLQQRRQQMDRQQLRIAVLGGEFVRALHRFLRFHCEFVPTNCHRNSC